MNLSTSRPKILCISARVKKRCSIREVLLKTKFEIIEAKSSESGIYKALEYTPDMIICQNDLDGLNGFQVYKILKDSLVKNGIPFFIFSDKFDREDILIGLEIGIDNFLFIPFDEESVIYKINNQLHKIKKMKFFDSDEFWQAFEATPVPKFMVVNKRFIKVNKAFRHLFEATGIKEGTMKITDVFDFSKLENSEINLKKCLCGLKQQCLFKSVPLKNNSSMKFDFHLVYSDHFGNGMFLGEVMPGGEMNDNGNFNGRRLHGKETEPAKIEEISLDHNANRSILKLTSREKEVLEWSSQGLPVKQIAKILYISERTVEKHRANILAKTQTSSIVEAIYAMQWKYG